MPADLLVTVARVDRLKSLGSCKHKSVGGLHANNSGIMCSYRCTSCALVIGRIEPGCTAQSGRFHLGGRVSIGNLHASG